MITLQSLGYKDYEDYFSQLTKRLCNYSEVVIKEDKSIVYNTKHTEYFLCNDVWEADELLRINNFAIQKSKKDIRNTKFKVIIDNKKLKNELKLIALTKLFGSQWCIGKFYNTYAYWIRDLAIFLTIKYNSLNSLIDIIPETAEKEWHEWLESRGESIIKRKYYLEFDKEYDSFTARAAFFRNMYNHLISSIDLRNLWDKDLWTENEMAEYGVYLNNKKKQSQVPLNFTKINNLGLKNIVKRYIKQRILIKHNLACSTAERFISILTCFCNFISDINIECNNFNKLTREDIKLFIVHLHNKSEKQGVKDSGQYFNRGLGNISKFLKDIQMYEYEDAPSINANRLIVSSDFNRNKGMHTEIKYIPDFVLDQIMKYIHLLDNRLRQMIYIMLKTGLRISDVLELDHNCLIKLRGEYWIKTDIEKTYVRGHKIPIDNELGDMLIELIKTSKEISNDFNNPSKYIFCHYDGPQRGCTYTSNWVRRSLNKFTKKNNIRDEYGEIWKFKNHSIRHTYAVKLINSGVGLFVIQDLLAHKSPEMTIVYAKLVDKTKKKLFEDIYKTGAFSFNENGILETNDLISTVRENNLDLAWVSHKLNAINTPYGICLHRLKGICNYAKEPPCLFSNNKRPCKNLVITRDDLPKYEVLIESTNLIINAGIDNGRDDWVLTNKILLQVYEDIYTTIKEGKEFFNIST